MVRLRVKSLSLCPHYDIKLECACVRGVGSLLTLELLRKFPMASSVARILLKV